MESEMSSILLFVYGTLKRGAFRNDLLHGQEFIAEVVTLPCYRLVDLIQYRGLVEDPEQGKQVQGELWRVADERLPELDRYEDVPRLFARKRIDLEGIAEPVFAYLYQLESDNAGGTKVQ